MTTPLISWDDNQRSYINRFSSRAVEAPTFENSVMGPLLRQSITTEAYGARQRFLEQEYDLTPYEGVAFNRSNIRAQLTAQNVAPNIIDEVMQSNVRDWHQVEARRAYLEQYYNDQFQIFEQLGTGGGIAAMMATSVFDPANLALTAGTAGFGAGATALGSAARSARVASFAARVRNAPAFAQFAAVGATEGAAGAALFESATGVYEEGSVLNAALLSAALGGTIGLIVGRGPQVNTTTFRDADGNPIPSSQVRTQQLANARQEAAEMEALATELADIAYNRERYTREAEESLAADRAATQPDLNARLQELDARRAEINTRLEAIRNERAAAAERTEGAGSRLDRLEQAQRASRDLDERAAAGNRVLEDIEGGKRIDLETVRRLAGSADDVNARLGGFTGRSRAKQKAFLNDPANRTAIQRFVRQQMDRIEKQKAATVAREGRLGQTRFTDAEFAAARKQLEELKLWRINRDQDLKKLEADLKDVDAQRAETKSRMDEALNNTLDRDVPVSDRTVNLQRLRDKYNVDPNSPETLRAFGKKYQAIQADIARMANGEYKGLSDVYGVITERQNFIDKLGRELQEVQDNISDPTKSTAWKRVPSWLRPILISPVEKLMASTNDLVVGFVNKLHAGTLHHGMANTRNAWNLRLLHDAQRGQMMHNVRHNYRKALEDGSFSGTLEEWNIAVGREAQATIGSLQRQLYANRNGAMPWTERVRLAREQAGSVTREYGTENPHIRRSIDNVLDYYEYVHRKGTEVEMEAFINSVGKGYMNRIYSPEAISRIGRDNAVQMLVDAQKKFAIATNKPWGIEDVIEARKAAETAIDAAVDPAALSNSIRADIGVQRSPTGSPFKQRSIEAFDDDIADLLHSDVELLTNMYAFKVHGRLALQQTIGASTQEGIRNLVAQLGATPAEQRQIGVVIDTILGVRELDKDPNSIVSRATKAASSFASVMHTMAFGLTSLTEVAVVGGEFGLGRTLNNFVGNPREVFNMYRNGTPSERNQVKLLVNYGDSHFNARVNRYDADNGFDSVGKLQQGLDKLLHYGSVYGGLVPVTDTLRMSAATMSVDFLARMSVAKNISGADMKRLLDMGFEAADLPNIRRALDVDDKGNINNMDRSSWGALDERINLGVNTMIERTVLNPNGATLPAFMTNYDGGGFMPRIFMKYLRFPMESIERLAYRGIQEMDAKRAVGVAASFAMWTLLLAAKDALRDEDKQMYADGNMGTLLKDALMYTSVAGGIGAALDLGFGMATGQNLTNDFSFRPGGAVFSQIGKMHNLIRGTATGDAALMGRGPTFNLPLYTLNIGEAFANGLQMINIIEETNK